MLVKKGRLPAPGDGIRWPPVMASFLDVSRGEVIVLIAVSIILVLTALLRRTIQGSPRGR